MKNKTIGIVIAIMLIGTSSAYVWKAEIDNTLHDLYCQNCTLDSPNFVNFSGFNNTTIYNYYNTSNESYNSTYDSLIYSKVNKSGDTMTDMLIFGVLKGIKSLTAAGFYSSIVFQPWEIYVKSGIGSNSNTTYHQITTPTPKHEFNINDINIITINTSTTNIKNTLTVNNRDIEASIQSLENNDTVNYIPYPRYNFTDLSAASRTFNTTYYNNYSYPIYIMIETYVINPTTTCLETLYINNNRIAIIYANVDYIHRDPSDYKSFAYIIPPLSNYALTRSGNSGCNEIIQSWYEHPYY